ncbi:Spy/CpxP family protein refolding chaperone [Sulfurimonas sp.]|uniref:Spy/CpxP family protein refolding chaperone n=1 Tax=Sulfurimonas sp. TaxID=2022749 RepID=UPI0039E4C304
MKKILIIVMLSLMALTNVQANQGNMNHALMHTNPLPNLMRVAVKNAKELHITDAQMKSLKTWSSTTKPKIKSLVKKVMQEERMLHKESLTTDNDVVAKAQTMLDARKEIIELKTQCRMNLKTILNEKQYKHLVKLYRQSRNQK